MNYQHLKCYAGLGLGAQATFDEATGVLSNAALFGRVALDKAGNVRWVATDAGMQSMADLAPGKPVGLNHLGEIEDQEYGGIRDIEKVIGKVEAARFDGAHVRGDVSIVPDQKVRAFIKWLVEKQPEGVGFSPDFNASLGGSQQQPTLEQVLDITEIDLVSNASTTRSLHGSKGEKTEMDWNDITVEGLQQNRPDLAEGLTAELKAKLAEEEQAKGQLSQELDAAKTELGEFKKKAEEGERENLINELVADSPLKDLPEDEKALVLNEPVVDQMMAAATGEDAKVIFNKLVERLNAVTTRASKGNTGSPLFKVKQFDNEQTHTDGVGVVKYL